MSGAVAAVLADAAALFRRERDLILRIAPPFLFLPALALMLLVPTPPTFEAAGDPTARAAWAQAVVRWAGAHGGWYVLAHGIGLVGTACLYALFLDRDRGEVRHALRRGLMIAPRLFLAMLVVGLPTAIGLYLWVLPGLYVMGRALLVGPALLAERPLGAVGAIGRSIALTRGHGLAALALVSVPLVGGWLLGQPFALAAGLMRGEGPANPVALALVEAGSAAAATAAGIAQALIAIAAYRRWASIGT